MKLAKYLLPVVILWPVSAYPVFWTTLPACQHGFDLANAAFEECEQAYYDYSDRVSEYVTKVDGERAQWSAALEAERQNSLKLKKQIAVLKKQLKNRSK